MQKYLLLFLFPMTLSGQIMGDISGSVNFYYPSRLSNGALINLPFRAADIKWQGAMGTMSLYSHLALEYRMPNISPSLSEAFQTENFALDLRELYLTWYFENSEIRIGKQIHSWGSVDTNSPIDNLNPYDYYYMFSIGAEQKIGSYSIAADYYLEDWKFRVYFSPYHQASRLPINDSEFPMALPANPTEKQIVSVVDPMEYALDITKSFEKGDVAFSYFNGYDRTFSGAGFNLWDNATQNITDGAKVDTIYSYRKTEAFGLGSVLFFEDLTLRGDVAYFTTKDSDINFLELDYLGSGIPYYLEDFYTTIRENDSEKFNTKAEYLQTNIQFELSLPYDIQFIGQYITYDTLQYNDEIPGGSIDISNLYNAPDIQFTPAEYFLPGLGTGLAILTKKVFLIDIIKPFNDNNIKLNLKAMLDKVDSGKLFELGIGYKITEHLNSYFAITKIFGDSRQDEEYAFNHMEYFSHIRMELKYYF